jgi:hypothetical protein
MHVTISSLMLSVVWSECKNYLGVLRNGLDLALGMLTVPFSSFADASQKTSNSGSDTKTKGWTEWVQIKLLSRQSHSEKRVGF